MKRIGSNVLSLGKNDHGYKMHEVYGEDLFSLVVAKLQLDWGGKPEKNDIARFMGLNRKQINCMLFFNNQRGQKEAMYKDAVPFLKMDKYEINKVLSSGYRVITEKLNYIRLLDFVGYFRSERYRRVRACPEHYGDLLTFEQYEEWMEENRQIEEWIKKNQTHD